MQNTISAYRQCFATDNGKRVLACILADLKHFEPAQTEDDKALQNYAILLLSKMGVYATGECRSRYVDKLVEVANGCNLVEPKQEE
jgi:hypothetical protein